MLPAVWGTGGLTRWETDPSIDVNIKRQVILGATQSLSGFETYAYSAGSLVWGL
jgi:hypothetical protein